MYTQYGNAMMGGQRVMDGGGFAFGGLGLLAFGGFVFVTALIVGLVIWAIVRKPSSAQLAAPTAVGQTPALGDSALAIARERLARGEIEPDQYQAIVNALNGAPPAAPAQG